MGNLRQHREWSREGDVGGVLLERRHQPRPPTSVPGRGGGSDTRGMNGDSLRERTHNESSFEGFNILVSKLTGYGAVLLASLAVAMALLVSAPNDEADAAAGSVALTFASLPANLTQTVTVTDTDLANGEFIIATIDAASTGTAQFAAGGGQSLVCLNGDATCDLDVADTTVIEVDIIGTGGTGTVVLNVRVVDGLDGVDGDPGDGDEDITTVAWQQTESQTLTRTVEDVDGTSISAFAADLDAVMVDISVVDQALAPVAGVEVNVSITVGDIAGDGTLCDPTGPAAPAPLGSDAGCTFDTTGAAADTITIVGDDVSGVGILTVEVEGFDPVVQEILFYGTATNVEVSVDPDFSDRISNNGGSTELTLAVTDANGIPVDGHTAHARLDPAVTANGLEVPASCVTVNGFCNIVVEEDTATGASPEGVQTVQVSLNLPFVTADSQDIELVGAAAAVTFVSQTPESPANLDTVSVTFICTTAGGLACLPGDAAAAATGAGIIIDTTPAIGADGLFTVQVIVEDLGGNVVKVLATVGAVSGDHNIVVGAGIGGGGTFSPPIAPAGQTFTVYSGGTVEGLIADLSANDATSATATLGDGSTVTVIVTTLIFVNADFSAAFPTVPAGTILAVRSVN
jgi:hypothetical protein